MPNAPIRSHRSHDADLYVWAAVATYLTVSIVTFARSRFIVDPAGAGAVVSPLLLGAAACIVGLIRFPGLAAARIVGTVLQFTLCGIGTAMLAFSAARLNMPLIDAQLLRFDRMLGYRWEEVATRVATSPDLEQLLTRAYEALFWQPILAAVVLTFDRDVRALNRYVVAHLLVMLFTVIVFALWPATTAWAHLATPAAAIERLHLGPTMSWVNGLTAIRTGVPLYVSPRSSFAIIGFPSYHCAAGMLFIYSFWRNRVLRYPVLAVNLAMIGSTPILGGHYIADILGAVGVTVAAIMLANRVLAPVRSADQAASKDRSLFGGAAPLREVSRLAPGS